MAKSICIAFPHGGIIPGSVMGEKEDVKVAAMTSIEVPEAYGRHLIDDRFAIEAKMPKKDDAKSDKKAVAEKAEAEKKSAAEKANAVKLAEEAVAAAKAKLEAAGDDMVAKAAAEDELKVAEAALAGLQS